MKPATFTYHRPASLDEALALLAQLGPDAKLLAGGQSMVPMLNLRLAQPGHLIDLNDLTEWARIRQRGEQLEIGFLTRHAQLAASDVVKRHCPLLADMAQTIAHHAIRNRGTLGGSLTHADPAAQLALMAVTLDARLHLRSQSDKRTLPATDFFQAAMTTALRPDELLLQVSIPTSQPGEVSAFQMFNRRHGDYALLAVAVTLQCQDNRVHRLRIGVAGASAVAQRLHAVESHHQGDTPCENWVSGVAQSVRDAIDPEDDPYIPASYRKHLAHTLTIRAFQQALGRLQREPT